MKFSFLAALLFLSQLLNGQNRLKSFYDVSPGSNYPNDMPHVQKWINTTLNPVFVFNMQFSDSFKGDNKFLSFTSSVGQLNLQQTGGLKLNFPSGSSNVKLIYTNAIAAYGHYNVSQLDYTLKEYFLLAKNIVRITNAEMIANTLNFMVITKNLDDNKANKLVDDINRQMKTEIPYAADQSLRTLMPVLEKQFPGQQMAEAIFMTYIQGKNEEVTQRNMQHFYQITGFFNNGVVHKIDDLMSPTFQLTLDKPALLAIPASMLKPATAAGVQDSLVTFNYESVTGRLSYKDKLLEMKFTGRLNRPATVVSGKLMQYEGKDYKPVLVKPKGNSLSPVDFTTFTLFIGEKSIRLEGESLQYDERYEFVNNKWTD